MVVVTGAAFICVVRSSVCVVTRVLGCMCILRSMSEVAHGVEEVAVAGRVNRVVVTLLGMVAGRVRGSPVVSGVMGILIGVRGGGIVSV